VKCLSFHSPVLKYAIDRVRKWPHSVYALALSGLAAATVLPFIGWHFRNKGIAHSSVSVSIPTLCGVLIALAVVLAYQELRVHGIRQQTTKREELFRIISENAADMIAVVDVNGKRLYNSPAYQTVLGYSPEELGAMPAFEQIHPDDRQKVIAAAQQARQTGVGKRLEYRIRHKNGRWMFLESTASTVLNAKGEVEKLVIVNRDITERRQFEERLEHNAFHDSLTDLPNRALFLDRLQHAFDRAQRDPRIYAVLFIDMDGFKVFNDTMGHTAGDQVIVDVGHRLAHCLRRSDTISRAAQPVGQHQSSTDDVLARLGGDVFTVLLDSVHDPSDAMRVAKRIQAALAPPFMVAGHKVFTSASIGIALGPGTYSKSEEMLRDAAIAMYRAKALGRSGCQLFNKEMHTRVANRLKLETDMRSAIDQQEFRVHYQPIVNLETSQLAGFEALVRWQHPERGLVFPGKFIDAAEETGLIIPIGRWVLREACRQAQVWQAKYSSDPALTITVNVSPKQLTDVRLVNDVEAALKDTKLDPNQLQLEVTESMSMSDPEGANRVLLRLKRLGVGISIDDFGTGHSSLSRLRDLAADVIKIDRAFIVNLDANAENQEIVRVVVALAHAFGLKIIAEGAETAAEAEQLKSLGCGYGQGYFFSPPLAPDHAERLLPSKILGGNCRLASDRQVTLP